MGNSVVIHPKICHKGGVFPMDFALVARLFSRNWPD